MKNILPALCIASLSLILFNCDKRPKETMEPFTKEDSLTDTYLNLEDTLLQVWNVMINDDNQKIKTMHRLIHALKSLNPNNADELQVYEQRLNQLPELRYSQKTMSNSNVVEEYDFASGSIVSELITLAESQPEYSTDTALQSLTEEILNADQRVNLYREQYDSVAMVYNQFIENNSGYLAETGHDIPSEKRPIFQMSSE